MLSQLLECAGHLFGRLSSARKPRHGTHHDATGLINSAANPSQRWWNYISGQKLKESRFQSRVLSDTHYQKVFGKHTCHMFFTPVCKGAQHIASFGNHPPDWNLDFPKRKKCAKTSNLHKCTFFDAIAHIPGRKNPSLPHNTHASKSTSAGDMAPAMLGWLLWARINHVWGWVHRPDPTKNLKVLFCTRQLSHILWFVW